MALKPKQKTNNPPKAPNTLKVIVIFWSVSQHPSSLLNSYPVFVWTEESPFPDVVWLGKVLVLGVVDTKGVELLDIIGVELDVIMGVFVEVGDGIEGVLVGVIVIVGVILGELDIVGVLLEVKDDVGVFVGVIDIVGVLLADGIIFENKKVIVVPSSHSIWVVEL